MSSKIVKAYLHSSKEEMRELGQEAGLSEGAQDEFRWALYEVEFTLEVQEDGSYTVLQVDGRDLAPKTAETRYEIWSEGYRIAGDSGVAVLWGSHAGASFEDAVGKYAASQTLFAKLLDPDKMSIWGCRLFDNETDARKAFG